MFTSHFTLGAANAWQTAVLALPSVERLNHSGGMPPYFLEFIQVNSFLIIPVLYVTTNNHQNLLLCLWGRRHIVSRSFSSVFVDAYPRDADPKLLTQTPSSILSNHLILGTVELWAFLSSAFMELYLFFCK